MDTWWSACWPKMSFAGWKRCSIRFWRRSCFVGNRHTDDEEPSMTEEPDLRPLDLLVLTRLLPIGEKGDKPEKIQKDLGPLLEHRWSGSTLTAVVDRALVKLTAQGLVTRLPTRRKNDVPSVALTPEGRQAALKFLKVSELPVKITWSTLKKSLLLARSLGLTAPGQALSSIAGFKAAVLRQKFGLP